LFALAWLTESLFRIVNRGSGISQHG
jgi:hypothetical protein